MLCGIKFNVSDSKTDSYVIMHLTIVTGLGSSRIARKNWLQDSLASKDIDQPVRLFCFIEVTLASPGEPRSIQALCNSECSDQIAWMHELIWAFTQRHILKLFSWNGSAQYLHESCLNFVCDSSRHLIYATWYILQWALYDLSIQGYMYT